MMDRIIEALEALADLDDARLDALIATADDCPQFAPSLFAWISDQRGIGKSAAGLEGPCAVVRGNVERWNASSESLPTWPTPILIG